MLESSTTRACRLLREVSSFLAHSATEVLSKQVYLFPYLGVHYVLVLLFPIRPSWVPLSLYCRSTSLARQFPAPLSLSCRHSESLHGSSMLPLGDGGDPGAPLSQRAHSCSAFCSWSSCWVTSVSHLFASLPHPCCVKWQAFPREWTRFRPRKGQLAQLVPNIQLSEGLCSQQLLTIPAHWKDASPKAATMFFLFHFLLY